MESVVVTVGTAASSSLEAYISRSQKTSSNGVSSASVLSFGLSLRCLAAVQGQFLVTIAAISSQAAGLSEPPSLPPPSFRHIIYPYSNQGISLCPQHYYLRNQIIWHWLLLVM